MPDKPLTPAQRAALIDARASILHGGLSAVGGVWVPDHPDLLHEHRAADIDALVAAGLLVVTRSRPLQQALITDDGAIEADAMSERDRLQAAVDLLERTPTGHRLDVLRRLVTVTGGRWDLPHSGGPRPYNPIMVSAHLFGVTAFADDVDELVANWLRVARNTIAGEAALEEVA